MNFIFHKRDHKNQCFNEPENLKKEFLLLEGKEGAL